ncbi:hypothetical protein [Qipengyuania qiaonensis]|uniref:PilZ domain-containing protein n=1 Tax=Qipengyuania qiaonensis TaxID=2867240 RepID=A0ABS7J8W8_9SPHN|nr:hypothetical protein [Qipengyuania qiaonensis]MBX7482509.1 hypothetical protein [Qipengyuania qiaonensis]
MSQVSHKPRIAASDPAILRRADGTEIACRFVDVSREGFRLVVPHGVPCGSSYTLSFASERHRVAIRWASLDEVGGEFLD